MQNLYNTRDDHFSKLEDAEFSVFIDDDFHINLLILSKKSIVDGKVKNQESNVLLRVKPISRSHQIRITDLVRQLAEEFEEIG